MALFDRVFAGPSWRAWRVWWKAAFGLALTDDERATYTTCTNRETLPASSVAVLERWVLAARRSGKTRMAACLAVFLSAVRTYRLAPGERGIVMVIAPGRRQAAIILDYAEAIIRDIPGVAIVRRTADEIELSTHITIAVQTASFRTPRGFTVVGAIVDEIAFLRSEDSSNPDTEILRALRPSLATVPGSMLICISSPYAQRGELWKTYERHFGKDADVLVWQAPAQVMNPTIDQGVIQRAFDDDPEAARAEWGAEFRSDIDVPFPREHLNRVVARDRFEIAPLTGVAYVGFVDPSGGSSDAFTLAIAHRDGLGRPVLDVVREVRPPFSPEAVCKEFAADLHRYSCRIVFSDSYAAAWPVEQFAKLGIIVTQSPLTRSELYLELIPMVNSGGCELLDHSRTLAQFAGLERRTGRTGRDNIDHRPGGHDDLANAAAGALVMSVRHVGLRAPLPADFVECINPNTTAAATCPLLARGLHWPSDNHCRRHCPGLRAVLPVYHQHRQAAMETGIPVLTAEAFLHERFDVSSSPLTSRSFHSAAIKDFEDVLGL